MNIIILIKKKKKRDSRLPKTLLKEILKVMD